MTVNQDFWNVLASNMQKYGVDKANEMLKQRQTTPDYQIKNQSLFETSKADECDAFISSKKISEE